MKKYKKFFLIVLMIGCTSTSFASTLRHIYNNSNETWFVQLAGEGLDIRCEKDSRGAWIIKPHTTTEMSYHGNRHTHGNLLICDSETDQRCYSGKLSINGGGDYISHNGNTGPAFDVNRPADGDIRIWKDHL